MTSKPKSKLEEQATAKGDLSYSSWASGVTTSDSPEGKKLSPAEAQAAHEMHKSASGSGSLWNAGQTFEERDISKWAKQELKQQLLGVRIDSGDIVATISSVTKVEGEAHIWVVRGKKRVGFEFHVDCDWSATVKRDGGPVQVSGTLSLPEVEPDELDELEVRDIKLKDSTKDTDDAEATQAALAAVRNEIPASIRAACRGFLSVLKERDP
mmetsp:Transcript_37438/g.88979  ORF Transcript_37438/g.88979 Transcript_37438/m.88979 type:complete len:211 (+) Transcript_37438:177-809(+)